MDGYPGWVTVLVLVGAGVMAFAAHLFGQGLWYMAAAERNWEQSTDRQRQRRQTFAYGVAFGGPALIIAGAITLVMLI